MPYEQNSRNNDDLREILVATGNASIIEHTENDSYWGDGGDGSGPNMLGRILMEIREELKATNEPTH
jgi:N-glycosidase YbiA